VDLVSSNVRSWLLKAVAFSITTQSNGYIRRSRSFKITDFGTNRSPIRLPISR